MVERRALPYRAALEWINDNDDTGWLDDEDPIASVTACLVADIYRRDVEEVICDLKLLRGF